MAEKEKKSAVNAEKSSSDKKKADSKGAKGAEKKPAVKSDAKPAKNAPKKPGKVAKYFKDLKSEFKKVVWPSRKTVVNNTAVVIAVMVLSGAAIAVMDYVFGELMLGNLLGMLS